MALLALQLGGRPARSKRLIGRVPRSTLAHYKLTQMLRPADLPPVRLFSALVAAWYRFLTAAVSSFWVPMLMSRLTERRATSAVPW